jgi:hypothetical protein
METKFFKERIAQIKDAQSIARKIFPTVSIEKTTSEYTVHEIELELDKVEPSRMEVLEVPISLTSQVKRVIDINLKITRPARTLTQTEFTKFAGRLASICFRTENKVAIDDMLANSVVLDSDDGIATWNTAKPQDIEEMIRMGVDEIRQLTQAKISLLVGLDKRKYLRKRNDHGISAESELKDVISEIYATKLLNGTNKAILVPYDPDIVAFNVAQPFAVTTEKFERTLVKIIATEAVCPAVENKEGVVVLSGI